MSERNGKGPVETSEYAAFLRRGIAAHGRRVAEGDVEDLADLLELKKAVDEAAAVAVAGLRSGTSAASWQRIADVLGTSRQAAMQRWPEAKGTRKPGGQPGALR